VPRLYGIGRGLYDRRRHGRHWSVGEGGELVGLVFVT